MELSGQIHVPAAALREEKTQPYSKGSWVGPRVGLDTAQSEPPHHASRAYSLYRLPNNLTEKG
jgi:hypothetical protein